MPSTVRRPASGLGTPNVSPAGLGLQHTDDYTPTSLGLRHANKLPSDGLGLWHADKLRHTNDHPPAVPNPNGLVLPSRQPSSWRRRDRREQSPRWQWRAEVAQAAVLLPGGEGRSLAPWPRQDGPQTASTEQRPAAALPVGSGFVGGTICCLGCGGGWSQLSIASAEVGAAGGDDAKFRPLSGPQRRDGCRPDWSAVRPR